MPTTPTTPTATSPSSSSTAATTMTNSKTTSTPPSRTLAGWLTSTGIVAAVALTAACSDAPSAPRATLTPGDAPARNTVSRITSQQITLGDTVITEFVVGTNTTSPASFSIGHTSRIDFPYASGSICDLATSSYGAGTWDQKCTASTKPVTITARVWKNAAGKVVTDFQPAMRFVPGLRKGVLLTIKDAATAGTRIDFCTLSGCIDESLTDASLKTVLDNANGFATRTIKHFSGYQIILGREGEEGSAEGGY